MSQDNKNQISEEELKQIDAFAKKSRVASSLPKLRSNNCVIYTRVSTKEQADNNMSLETQAKYCRQFAERSKFNIVQTFGGTYESAKNDERKEFKRMLDFIKRQASPNRISYIVVYSTDRFSRSGANAISIASDLKKQGISLISVTQPTDTQSASGSLQQNIQFIFSEYDNQQRREKCTNGTRERLLQGFWVTKAPLGYNQITQGQNQTTTINKQGELLKLAFEWKAEGQLSVDIVDKLNKLGLEITAKRLSEIFRNPFYCGLLSHNLLDELVPGRHPALVSKEVFLKANEILRTKRPEYKVNAEDAALPLKRIVKCSECGTTMVGYEVKKKKIHYYKCNKNGCKTNRSAKLMHESFTNLLGNYQIEQKYIAPLQVAMKDLFYSLQDTEKEGRKAMKDNVANIKKNLEKLEERFALGEIDKAMFEKFGGKYKAEIGQIEATLKGTEINLSNLDSYLAKTLQMAQQMPFLWQNADLNGRRKLQQTLFPQGIVYDRINGNYRTENVNVILKVINCLSGSFNKEKSGLQNENSLQSAFVAGSRIELPTLGL